MKSQTFYSAVVLAIAMASSASAIASDMYFVGSVGPSKTDGSSSNGTAIKLQLGYQLSPSIAVEGGYIDAGTQTYTFNGVSVDAKTTGASIAVLGLAPLNDRLALFGKFGYNSYSSTVSVAGYGGAGTGSTSGALFGVGGNFKLSDSTAIRLEFEKITSDTLLSTIGLQLKF